MKVKKIKIEQELLDIDHNGRYQEASTPEVSYMSLREGEVPSTMMTSTITNYEVRQIWNGKEKENYLVKVADLKVFDDLLRIGIDDIQRIVDKQVDDYKDTLDNKYMMDIISKKRKLENNPLWRRIFKKYN